MNDFLEILISCVVLICAAALLRLIAKYRWLLVVTSLVWIALVRFVYRQGGNQGLIIVGVLTALLVITALILPWIGRLKVVLVVKGSFILLWRKVRSLANVAESAAREEPKKE